MSPAADDEEPAAHPGASSTSSAGPRFYGRRRGHKLRPGLQRLVDERLPALRIAPPGDGGTVDVRGLFPQPPATLHLEIGFGGGEHLARQAASHPEDGFVGCEPFLNGVATLLREVESQGLANIRIFDEDARLLLPRLPEAAFATVHLLYNDPWPKTRHHRRRLVQPEVLDAFARVLADGGRFLFASDHAGYVAWTLRHACAHPAFEWTARRARDWRTPPDGWVGTRYEEKALAKGIRPSYLEFRRRRR